MPRWWLCLWIVGCAGEAGEDEDGDGFLVSDGDCDDLDAEIAPGVEEQCDGVDQDCNGIVDDDPVDGETYWVDDDRDGYGVDDRLLDACARPDGYADAPGDCDDDDDAVNPGAEDAGDVDRNCDGEVPPSTPEILSANATCAGSTLTFEATTVGRVDHLRWYLTDNGNNPAWAENHTLIETADGAWSLDLDIVDFGNDVQNVSTIFPCDIVDSSAMSFVAAMFDRSGDQLDCVSWGADPDGIVEDPSDIVGPPPDPEFDILACRAP